MRLVYDDTNYHELIKPWNTDNGFPQALPRRSRYGAAEHLGLVPLEDDLELVPEDSIKEVIEECHREKLFPMYHQAKTWAPDGYRWNQDGLPYCWAWGCTACVMDARAVEGQETVQLAPVTLGWLVGWRDRGYFLDETLNGARQRGIAPAEYVPNPHNNSPASFKSGWEKAALDYRPTEWWETRQGDNMLKIRQALTILRAARSLYVALAWWGHALSICGMEWDESSSTNITWLYRNSHNEDSLIRLKDSKGVPSEFYGLRAASFA